MNTGHWWMAGETEILVQKPGTVPLLSTKNPTLTRLQLNNVSKNNLGQAVAQMTGTALQAGRTRVRFPMASKKFFIEIILLAALWHWSPWG
jgi:hypothetical protein